MKTKLKYYALLALLFGAALFAVFGCDHDTPSTNQQAPSTNDVHLASDELQAGQAVSVVQIALPTEAYLSKASVETSFRNAPDVQALPCKPALIAIFLDFSTSTSEYGVELPTRADVAALIPLLEKCGGEIGVGAIQENARQRLIRLRIEAPPAPVTEPKREDYSNVFAYNKDRRSFKERRAEYEAQLKEREARDAPRIRVFLDRVERLVEPGATAGSTDVWGALKRGASFLDEDPLSWPVAPNRYLALITDGYHNRRGTHYEPLPQDVIVLVAHGSSDLGALNQLDPPPRCFESVQALFRYIRSDQNAR